MREVFIVPHFHYDAAWLKTREEYLQICHQIILDVLELLHKHRNYRFMLEQAYLVRSFLERFPEQRKYLEKYIREKRVELTGTFICPDVNIPSGESLIQQIVKGWEYFKKEFNTDIKTGYMVDVFGSHPQMPQILSKAGIKNYIMSRGMDNEQNSEFIWRGLDGSDVLCYWCPLTCTVLWPVPANMFEFKRKIEDVVGRLDEYSTTGKILLMSGYDYTPPSPELPSLVDDFKSVGISLKFSTLDEYFRKMCEDKDTLPISTKDYNPVFQGCYSSRIKLKQENRYMENFIERCEALHSMCKLSGTASVPLQSIEEVREKILFNQFHDIICGSHNDPVYHEALDDYKYCREILSNNTEKVLDKLTENSDTNKDLLVVTIINTAIWRRTDLAEVLLSFSTSDIWSVSLEDVSGKTIVHQEDEVQRFDNGSLKSLKLSFIAENVPAFGHKSYKVIPNGQVLSDIPVLGKRCLYDARKTGRGGHDGLGLVECAEIENEFFKIIFDIKKGVFTSIKSKSGEEFINPKLPLGNVITKEIDEGDPWQYNEQMEGGETIMLNRLFPFPEPWEADFSHKHQTSGMARGDIKLGPVYAQIISEAKFGSGYRKIRVKIYKGIPRIDVSTSIINNEEFVRYRISFPSNIKDGTITREIPFGAVQQPEGEFPCQNWMDYSDPDKGLCILNRGICGQGVIASNIMLSVLRCINKPDYLDGEFKGASEKNIEHTFEYSLLPHEGDWKKEHLSRQGYEFNNPLIVKKHMGQKVPEKVSFLEIPDGNINVSTVRNCNGALLVRIYESEGIKTNSTLKIHNRCSKVTETDFSGNKLIREFGIKNREILISMDAFEIKTFLLEIMYEIVC